ncbi:unnamed protein product, partial [Trichobilharzia regenti]
MESEKSQKKESLTVDVNDNTLISGGEVGQSFSNCEEEEEDNGEEGEEEEGEEEGEEAEDDDD